MSKINGVASLVVYGQVPGLGWRRGRIAFAGNGVPKSGVLISSGVEYSATHWTYQIRSYQNRGAHYVTIGTEYDKPKTLLERMMLTRQREAIERKLGKGVPLPKTELELAAEEADRVAARLASRKTLKMYAE